MKRNVGMTARGSVRAAMIVRRMSRRKTMRTMVASRPPMMIASRTLPIAPLTN